jgi:hypothetical protein
LINKAAYAANGLSKKGSSVRKGRMAGPLACSVHADGEEGFFYMPPCRKTTKNNISVEREMKLIYNPCILVPGNNTI